MPHDLDCSASAPPVAPVEITRHELHGRRWDDEYGWMRDHTDPRLLAYLRAEREYYDEAAVGRERLRDELFHEVEQRLLPTDDSVSWRHGSVFYYTRTVTGSEYGQFLRRRNHSDSGDATLDIVLDEAELAGSDGYAAIGVRELSPDNGLLAYSVDTTGDEVYRLRFRDLSTLTDLPEELPRTYYTGAWSADSRTFFYTVHDRLFRPYQVWRHTIGTSVSADVLVRQEDDARFELTVAATRDGEWIVIEARSRTTTEHHLVPASDPAADPILALPRLNGVEARVEHADGHLIITTNATNPEFEVSTTPVTFCSKASCREAAEATLCCKTWQEAGGAPGATLPESVASRPGERVVRCHPLRGFILVELRRDGFPLLRAVNRDSSAEVEIGAGIEAGTVTLLPHFDYADTAVTIRVESLIEPPSWWSVDLATGERTLLKRIDVVGHDPAGYRTERRYAIAPDGTEVPVTLAWHAATSHDGTAPALLWGYGAYESCDDPAFDELLPSLLDRGVVYALTHPRGGGENGRRWWLDGHLASKANTFTDHIAVADWLAASGVADGARIASRGLSAGGLLQGVAFNRRPDRWAAIVAEVPFVDVVTSMLDPDIPLTVNEWEEWGDPRKPDELAWLWAYSPYENAPDGPRPALLVTAALHDPRVMVHEPAKWVARLRASASPADGPLYLRTELGAGAHTGPAGRYAHFRYEAEIAAFILTEITRA